MAEVSIPWEDPALVTALGELRAIEGASEVLAEIGSEYLAAAFLVAKDMDPTEAMNALRNTAEWRKTSGSKAARQRMLAEPSLGRKDFPHMSEVETHLPQCEGGPAIDMRGIPYAIRCIGLSDAAGLFEKITEDEMLEWQLWVTESRLRHVEAYAQRSGRLAGITLVQDLMAPQGLLTLWREHGDKMSVMKHITHMMDEHYPGLMGSVLLVNAPWVIHAILQVVTSFLPAGIMKRVEVLPPHLTSARLLELVEPDHLPQFLGGAADDAQFIPSRASMVAVPGTEVLVKAGAAEERSLWLQQGHVAGYGLSVEGGAQGQDIMFSCRFEVAESEEVESSDVREVRSPGRITEDSGGSSFVAPSPGRLVLVFDNTFSWMYSKTVRYELAVLPTDHVPKTAPPQSDR